MRSFSKTAALFGPERSRVRTVVNQDQGPLMDMQGEVGPAGLAKELLEPSRMIKDADSNGKVPEYTVHHRPAGGPTRTRAPLVP